MGLEDTCARLGMSYLEGHGQCQVRLQVLGMSRGLLDCKWGSLSRYTHGCKGLGVSMLIRRASDQ